MGSPLLNLVRRARTYGSTYGIKALVRETLTRFSHRVAHPDTPNRFHVEISNTCNFDCEYCVLREQSTGDKVMTEATFDAILPYLKNASSVALSGLAEPLMNKRFPDFLSRIRSVAPHSVIAIDTNASLLTREISESIVDSHLDSLVFSLDGVDEELVDGIRLGGSLGKLVDNIRILGEVKREKGSDSPVLAATMVLQRKNVSQLPAVVRLAADLGVRMININSLEPYEGARIDDALWTGLGDDRELVRATVTEAARIAEDKRIDLRFPSLSPQDAHCSQMGRPVILADGTVVPCSVLAYHRNGFLRVGRDGLINNEQTSTDRMTFGNVNERTLPEIWSDPAYKEFRSRVFRGDFPEECAGCLIKHNIICANDPLPSEEFLAQIDGARS